MRAVIFFVFVILCCGNGSAMPWDRMCTVKSGIATCFKQPPDGIMSDGVTSGSMIRTFKMLIRVNTIAYTPSKYPKLSLVTGFAVCKEWQMFQGLTVNGKKCPSIIPDTKTYHDDDMWVMINTGVEYALLVVCDVALGIVVMILRKFYRTTTEILQDLTARVIGGNDGNDGSDGNGQDHGSGQNPGSVESIPDLLG